jgi:hypothetical protein
MRLQHGGGQTYHAPTPATGASQPTDVVAGQLALHPVDHHPELARVDEKYLPPWQRNRPGSPAGHHCGRRGTLAEAPRRGEDPSMNTTEDLYNAATALPVRDRLRLVERIIHDLAQVPVETRAKWMDLEGAAPDLLDGEDAQTWVSRTRGESDEGRAVPGGSRR